MVGRELAGHYYQPRILALTHTVTLGWITLTIMGASYQILPIVLERPIWSERLGRWQFALLAVGIVGMVGHFFIGEWSGLLWGAGFVALGTVAHLTNAVMSVRGLRQWTFTARLVALALAGFALTLVFGLALAVNRLWPFLPPATFPWSTPTSIWPSSVGCCPWSSAWPPACTRCSCLLTSPEDGRGGSSLQAWPSACLRSSSEFLPRAGSWRRARSP